MQGYKVMVQLDDWDRSIVEYDGVVYTDWIEVCRVCNEAKEFLDAYIEAVGV